MREAQREYFRGRSSAALTESKRLESEVDAEIQRAERVLYEKQNPYIVQQSIKSKSYVKLWYQN